MSALARSSLLRASRASASCSPVVAAASRLRFISTSPARMSGSTGSTGGGATGDEPLVTFSSEGHARIYTLNRPKKLNSLNHEMITLLSTQLTKWRDAELCNLIIGRGNERAFCAGGDVAHLVKEVSEDKDTGIRFFKDEFETNWLMAHLGKPYISLMDGIVMGGGAGIALPAPIRIATSRTTFAMPETAIGYAPDVGVNYYLAQLDGYIGHWLAVTGQSIYGRSVYELGLATHYVAPSALPNLVRELTHHSNPTLANLSKLVATFAGPLAEGAGSKANPDGSSALSPAIRNFLDATFALPSIRDIHHRLQGAAQDDSLDANVKAWAAEQLTIIEGRSPTGMAVALEGVTRARKAKRLDTVLRNDMSMASSFCLPKGQRKSNDFVTGVTHVLIDKVKGQRANWGSTIEEMTPEAVSPFFEETAAPELALPKSSPGADERWNVWRRQGLPTDRDIRDVVRGDAKGSGRTVVNEQELVERLTRESQTAEDVQRAVRSAVERKCETDKDGYLTWMWEAEEERRSRAKM